MEGLSNGRFLEAGYALMRFSIPEESAYLDEPGSRGDVLSFLA